jgi:hypothetical protein
MRHKSILIIALIAGLGAACSGDSDANDPIKVKCQSVCAIDTSNHCFNRTFPGPNGTTISAKDTCLQKCEVEAKKAEQGRLAGCGLCVAEGIIYSHKTDSYCQQGKADPTCCYGVASTREPEGKECVLRCYSPDGALPY